MSDCVYCGAAGETIDHVTPISFNYTRRPSNAPARSGERVPCCRECNSLLGAKALFSVPERAHEVAGCLERRYRKELNAPVWTDEELGELEPGLRQVIRSKQYLRDEVIERIRNASSVGQGLLEQALPLWRVEDGSLEYP